MYSGRSWIIAALVCVAVGWAQAWLLDLHRVGWTTFDETSSLSYRYTKSLANGQTYLPFEPDPELANAIDPYAPELARFRRGDLSYYRGHFYLYFGVVPFATLMVPFYKLSGTYLTDAAAIWIYSMLGLTAYFATLIAVVERQSRSRNSVLLLLAFTATATGSGVWALLARPAIYELASAAAYSMFGLAISCWTFALFAHRKAWLGLGLGALFASLAIGCRPNYAGAVSVVVFLLLWLIWCGQFRPARQANTLALLLPLACIGALLAWFNLIRFDDPLEFGFRYQSAGFDRLTDGASWQFRHVFYNLHRYLAGLPRVGRYFPFFLSELPGPFALPPKHEPTVLVYGTLLTAPVLLASAIVFRTQVTKLRWALLTTLLAGAANLSILAGIGNGCYRYSVDFVGPVSFAAGAGILCIAHIRSSPYRLSLVAFTALASGATACASLFQFISIAESWSQFSAHRPKDFVALSRPFNRAVFLTESLTGCSPHSFKIRLRLPLARFGQQEPLLVTGLPGSLDFLYFHYVAPGLLQIGFDSFGHLGPVSGHLPVEYEREHEFELRYGSFLPPDGHPMLGGKSDVDTATTRHTVTVLMDGRIVLDGNTEFNPTGGVFNIGSSPYDSAYGARFTGEITSVTYPPLPAVFSEARFSPAAYGPITFALTRVPMPNGTREPLLSCGHRNQGSILIFEHIDPKRARLGWRDTLGNEYWTTELDWPDSQSAHVQVRLGSLFPPKNSKLWTISTVRQHRDSLKETFSILLNGQQVLNSRVETLDVSPATIVPGRDMLMILPRVAPSVTSGIAEFARLEWDKGE
jgi:hypothetical protein